MGIFCQFISYVIGRELYSFPSVETLTDIISLPLYNVIIVFSFPVHYVLKCDIEMLNLEVLIELNIQQNCKNY